MSAPLRTERENFIDNIDWLKIHKNASTMNTLMEHKIAKNFLNRTSNNTNSSTEYKDEQQAEEKFPMEKCLSLTGKLISALDKQN